MAKLKEREKKTNQLEVVLIKIENNIKTHSKRNNIEVSMWINLFRENRKLINEIIPHMKTNDSYMGTCQKFLEDSVKLPKPEIEMWLSMFKTQILLVPQILKIINPNKKLKQVIRDFLNNQKRTEPEIVFINNLIFNGKYLPELNRKMFLLEIIPLLAKYTTVSIKKIISNYLNQKLFPIDELLKKYFENVSHVKTHELKSQKEEKVGIERNIKLEKLGCTIQLSQDLMSATISKTGKIPANIKPVHFIQLLKRRIKTGLISVEEFEKHFKQLKEGTPFIVAKGIDGDVKKTKLIYFFEKVKAKAMGELLQQESQEAEKTGIKRSIDWNKQAIEIQLVEPETVLVLKEIVESEINKTNVLGMIIEIDEYRDLASLLGENVKLVGNEIISKIKGQPVIENGQICVKDTTILTKKGISSNENRMVKAEIVTEDVHFKGEEKQAVEVAETYTGTADCTNFKASDLNGATITAEGDIIINFGITSSTILSCKKLTSKFIQNKTTIYKSEIIKVDTAVTDSNLLNCKNIEVGQSINNSTIEVLTEDYKKPVVITKNIGDKDGDVIIQIRNSDIITQIECMNGINQQLEIKQKELEKKKREIAKFNSPDSDLVKKIKSNVMPVLSLIKQKKDKLEVLSTEIKSLMAQGETKSAQAEKSKIKPIKTMISQLTNKVAPLAKKLEEIKKSEKEFEILQQNELTMKKNIQQLQADLNNNIDSFNNQFKINIILKASELIAERTQFWGSVPTKNKELKDIPALVLEKDYKNCFFYETLKMDKETFEIKSIIKHESNLKWKDFFKNL